VRWGKEKQNKCTHCDQHVPEPRVVLGAEIHCHVCHYVDGPVYFLVVVVFDRETLHLIFGLCVQTIHTRANKVTGSSTCSWVKDEMNVFTLAIVLPFLSQEVSSAILFWNPHSKRNGSLATRRNCIEVA
jgi:hypothetical protein